ncbi:MAG: tRNA 5-methylaminomethyl-2-thiouridine biosynthesis bifunctional protein MnmC [Hyphomicrobiaceae bacterium hypho_1]
MTDYPYADIIWDDNDTPISLSFSDPYYSRTDGQSETRHVFLKGNGLPKRWHKKQDFIIGELGFGTGLNFLETVSQWNISKQTYSLTGELTYVAFEKFPMSKADFRRALKRWHGLSDFSCELIAFWPPRLGWSCCKLGSVTLCIAIGDAKDMLATWDGAADAWYLDGFSPAKNPDLWDIDLFQTMAKRTSPKGTFATFTAAGWVKRNLQASGFNVIKMPGFGCKRDSLRGFLVK